ncbi:DUF1566 domain-containing protein [Thermodesulfobacteriota bacterium]
MKKLSVLIFCFSMTLMLTFSMIAFAGLIPDTGQTQSYTDTFGEDSDYLINPPSYTKLDANGDDLEDTASSWVMVRDNVTGLIWEVKTDDSTIHDKDNTYTWYDSNPETNGGYAGTPGDGTDTEDFISNLNASSFGGFSDWRLPTVKELASIVKSESYSPAINFNYFPKTVSSLYWPSTTFAGDTHWAWTVDFYDGGIDYSFFKSSSYYVRAVRGGQSDNSFVDNGDGTVTDTSTGLMWQQATVGPMNWESALTYCEGLSLPGGQDAYNDWRLPNRNELQSLGDYNKYNPAIDTVVFPGMVEDCYWSSTTSGGNDTEAWTWDLWDSGVGRDGKSHSNYVRAVRNISEEDNDSDAVTVTCGSVTVEDSESCFPDLNIPQMDYCTAEVISLPGTDIQGIHWDGDSLWAITERGTLTTPATIVDMNLSGEILSSFTINPGNLKGLKVLEPNCSISVPALYTIRNHDPNNAYTDDVLVIDKESGTIIETISLHDLISLALYIDPPDIEYWDTIWIPGVYWDGNCGGTWWFPFTFGNGDNLDSYIVRLVTSEPNMYGDSSPNVYCNSTAGVTDCKTIPSVIKSYNGYLWILVTDPEGWGYILQMDDEDNFISYLPAPHHDPRGITWIDSKLYVAFKESVYLLSPQYDPDNDVDNDCISDDVDNCPSVANPNQADLDSDGIGDLCDPVNDLDNDNDGVLDISDNCPLIANPDQADNDLDLVGDVCDTDDDNDGITDTDETACGSDPTNSMSTCEICDGTDNDLDGSIDEGFTDTDLDGSADCVDTDDDNDGITDDDEVGLGTDPLNPDTDGDSIGDGVDACPLENATGHDADSDGCIDVIEDLPQVIEDINLPSGTESSLTSKVENAQASIDRGNIETAIHQLEAFINQIEAQRGKKISEEDADMLIEYATNLIDSL